VIAWPDQAALLWNTDIGVKMSLFAIVALALNAGRFVLACVLANRSGSTGVRRAVSIVAGLVLTMFFYLPSAFVVLIGPAAIQIQNSMTNY
jgi:hypothetical protein